MGTVESATHFSNNSTCVPCVRKTCEGFHCTPGRASIHEQNERPKHQHVVGLAPDFMVSWVTPCKEGLGLTPEREIKSCKEGISREKRIR